MEILRGDARQFPRLQQGAADDVCQRTVKILIDVEERPRLRQQGAVTVADTGAALGTTSVNAPGNSWPRCSCHDNTKLIPGSV